MKSDLRFHHGMDYLCKVEGTPRPATLDALSDIAPDLAGMAISFVYGELYSRPGLTLRERQLITVAALAALGNATPQLKFHIAGALNVGCTPCELIEALMHVTIYAGFPASLNAIYAAKEVFEQKEIRFESVPAAPSASVSRYDAGWRALQEIDGHAGERVIASLQQIAPDLGRFVIEFSFGDIYTRPGLGLVERELVTLGALAALGTGAAQLKVHVDGLLNVGGSATQAVEAAIQVAAYAGFPAAINAVLGIEEVLKRRAAA
jgi:4-carboxymuconolactone decarboxylase